MKFDPFTLNNISRAVYRKASPTEELLLSTWGSQNHTILELFSLLKKMKHYQAMGILKPFGTQICLNTQSFG